MLQSEIVVVLLIFIPRSYKSQNSYIGLDLWLTIGKDKGAMKIAPFFIFLSKY